MDPRWTPRPLDSKGDFQIVLHPTASVSEVRRGGTTDDFDLSPFVVGGNHSLFDCNVTLAWATELFGVNQPKPTQVIEVRLREGSSYLPVWIGVIESMNGFTLSRGEQQMQLVARSRDSHDIWRTTKRVTDLFPQMTDLAYIMRKIAMNVGLDADEILIPATSIATSHSNTQMAEMSAWEMLTGLGLPVGWTPFMDALGRLRVASRDLNGRMPDIVVGRDQLVRVNAQKQLPPASRVRLKWLNPVLKKYKQQGRKLAELNVTTGWFIPSLRKTVWFSDDHTQRAESTYMEVKQSANAIPGIRVCRERYEQVYQNEGRITLTNYAFAPAIIGLIGQIVAAATVPDGVVNEGVVGGHTVPIGRRVEAAFSLLFMMAVISIGTGLYEIWGTPYDWVHARNTTDAFASNLPKWVDNPTEIESDFIKDEPHAQAVAVRELIYLARAANKWTAVLWDDPRIEFGDVLELPNGMRMYVEDVSRPLQEGSEGTIEVKGFLIANGAVTQISNPIEVIPTDPGIGGGGGGASSLPAQAPVLTSVLQQVFGQRRWYFDRGDDYDRTQPDGRGGFTEAAVAALHAQDARFGHIRKNPGQNQYNGHAVDAINFLNDDGTTAEIYDIISGSANGIDALAWGFVDRTAANRNLWYF